MDEFKKELEALINRYSIEDKADVPDFILAEMFCGFIESIGSQIKRTLDWHGCDSVCHPTNYEIMDWEILYSTKPAVGVKEEELEPIEEMPTEFGIMGFVEPTFGYRSKINELIQRVNLLSAKEK